MESPQTKKSGLNLPAGMSGTSLRLDTFASSPSSSRSIASLTSPSSLRSISNLTSPSKSSTCSDRFIPCRSSSRLHTFGLVDRPSPVKEGSNEAYSRLLKCELFGSDFASPSSLSSPSAGASPSPISPSKNMLRFKTDHSTAPSSPYSPSILGQQSTFASDSSTPPPKPPRKVPKTPHKAGSFFSFFSFQCVYPFCVCFFLTCKIVILNKKKLLSFCACF